MRLESFTVRLTVWFAALVTLTTAALLAVGGWLLDREMVNGLQRLHEVEFRELSELVDQVPVSTAEDLTRLIKHDSDSDAALFYIQVHNRAGSILFRSANLGDVVLPDLSGRAARWTERLPQIGPVHVSEFYHGDLHFQIASPLAPTRRALIEYVRVAAMLVGLTAVVSLGLGYGFSRIALRPIGAIEETARKISTDTLKERIAVSSCGDEISRLAGLLNEMFDRLEAGFNETKRFTADASHELKTPLALIRLNAERLRTRFAADVEATSAIGELNEEIARMQQIIEGLLFIAKADSGVLGAARTLQDVAPLLEDVGEDARALAEDRGMVFSLTENPSVLVVVERMLIRQMVLNLVSNALKASQRGGAVEVRSSVADGLWRLEVRDRGTGLPPAQLERVFERFVRFDTTRHAGQPGGHGLGLAICRSIAGFHGGQIWAENRTDGDGLRVVVELPLPPTAS